MKPPAMFCRDTPLMLRDHNVLLLLYRQARAPRRIPWWVRLWRWLGP